MTLTTPRPPRSAAVPGSVWVDVCALEDLDPDRGSAVLVGDQQVAVFRLRGLTTDGSSSEDELYAVGNRDPFCGANVLARGIVGSAGETAYVASPMHKQRFDLRTGQCLDEEEVVIPVWPVRAVDGRVELSFGGRHGC
ncbi:MAG TPA: nitrite reductase small subunit NirD [Acidimicrobiales bacterium]|jgi:nitrite reductase (NADH) small subunit